jgi:hypothetical protein
MAAPAPTLEQAQLLSFGAPLELDDPSHALHVVMWPSEALAAARKVRQPAVPGLEGAPACGRMQLHAHMRMCICNRLAARWRSGQVGDPH